MVPSPKMGSGKFLVNEKLPGSQLCPNMLCHGLWSPMSQTHPGITEPKLNCTFARVMGYPGNTTEKPTQIWQVEDMLPVLNSKFLIPCLILCGFQLSIPQHTHTHTNSMGKKVTSNQKNGLRPTFEKKSHYITPEKERLVLLIQDSL